MEDPKIIAMFEASIAESEAKFKRWGWSEEEIQKEVKLLKRFASILRGTHSPSPKPSRYKRSFLTTNLMDMK